MIINVYMYIYTYIGKTEGLRRVKPPGVAGRHPGGLRVGLGFLCIYIYIYIYIHIHIYTHKTYIYIERERETDGTYFDHMLYVYDNR